MMSYYLHLLGSVFLTLFRASRACYNWIQKEGGTLFALAGALPGLSFVSGRGEFP